MYFAALLGEHRDAGRPVALCDPNATRMAYYNGLWRGAYPDAGPLPTYQPAEFGAMLERERPHVVIVTSVDRTHHRFIREALARGCDVVTEKPLTVDAEGCRVVVDAVRRGTGNLVLTFNYRYAPRNQAVKELIAAGAIGEVTSVHFEWLLDTVHGADYFRRWHRDKRNSGGLLVHKATHHFDLVNWWLDAVPDTVFAFADLRFYGARNAADRGMTARPRRSHGAAGAGSDPFALDLSADPRLARLYLEAEHEDGYHRDLDVFSAGITIEDNMSVLVRYQDRTTLTYSLNAHAPWEGYRVGVNGTAGRLDLEVVERAHVTGEREPGTGHHPPARDEGATLLVQRHWEPARRVEIPRPAGGDGSSRNSDPAGHGGGDALLLDDVFRGVTHDPYGRQAGYADGVRSVLVGAAANRSAATGCPVQLSEFGIPID